MKRRSLVVAVGLACSLLAGKALAALNLVETIWVAQSPGCTIREIRFYDFGHALVKAEQIGSAIVHLGAVLALCGHRQPQIPRRPGNAGIQ